LWIKFFRSDCSAEDYYYTGITFAEPSDTYLEATVMIMSTFATGAIKVPLILPNFL